METKLITAAFCGEPNVGKSSLFNAILGEKISIVTHKKQTTRTAIRGVLTKDNIQYVFVDTPGIFDGQGKLEKFIVGNAVTALSESDVICLVLDAKRPRYEFIKSITAIAPKNAKFIAVLNKVDLLPKPQLLPIAKQLDELNIFSDIVFVSATKPLGLENLLSALANHAEAGPFMFAPDTLTDTPQKVIAEEITREQVFILLHDELPYATKVETELWQEDEKSVTIHQAITVMKESQKVIVLGKNGEKIKSISIKARLEIAKLLGRKVNLFLHVKTRANWQDKL
jgi:GTP-binding protein Era